MSNSNRYLAQQIAVYGSPITYTSTTGSATATIALTTTRANIDLLIAMLSLEGAEQSINRYFLDEMSPQARITLIKTLTDLKTVSIP